MKIFEVRNNLVKIFYNSTDNLFLSSFVMIKDSRESFIGQVMHLESNKNGNLAVLKLIFNVTNDGVITTYKGSIPTIKSIISSIDYSDFLNLIKGSHPVVVGDSIELNTPLLLDKSLFENKLVICCEKQPTADLLIKRFVEQIKQYRKKTVIIDIDGEIELGNNTLTASENFKLPINPTSLEFIYQKATQNAEDAKSKAIIQEVILELQYYAKTVPDGFIPVNYFIDLLETQYNETGIAELVLLKNELLKYHEAGIFAQERAEFQNVVQSLIQDEPTVINLAYIDEDIQKEFISYLYSTMDELNSDFYVFLKLGNHNSTKKLLKQVYSTSKVNTSVICSYSYKYLLELKKISKNLILFTPILQQEDFASYNTFLTKLDKNEFVIYGKTTQYVPLIAKISSMSGTFAKGLKKNQPDESEVQMQEQMKIYLEEQEVEKEKKIAEEKLKQQAEEQMKLQQQLYLQELMKQQAQAQQQMQQQFMMQNYIPQGFMQMPQMQLMIPPQMIPQGFMQMPQQMALQNFQVPVPTQIINPETEMMQPQENKQEGQTPNFVAIEPQAMPVEPNFEKNASTLTETDLDLIDNADVYNQEPSQLEVQQKETPVDKMKEAFERQKIDDLIEDTEEFEQEQNFQDLDEPEDTEIIEENNDLEPIDVNDSEEDNNELDENLGLTNLTNTAQPNISMSTLPKYTEDSGINVESDKIELINFEKGEKVSHEKFGIGVIEKTINYGSKKLYSIYFEEVGRRLLDPKVSNLTRAD